METNKLGRRQNNSFIELLDLKEKNTGKSLNSQGLFAENTGIVKEYGSTIIGSTHKGEGVTFTSYVPLKIKQKVEVKIYG